MLQVPMVVKVKVSIQDTKYSEISLLGPHEIKTSYLLKTLLAKFKLFFSFFSTPSVPLIRDQLWDCPKDGLNIGILLYPENTCKFPRRDKSPAACTVGAFA